MNGQRRAAFAPPEKDETRTYSAAVRWDSLLFTSGYTGVDPASGTVPAGIKAQTRHSLEAIRRVLEVAGSSLDRVVKVTVFLTDMREYREMNEVYREYFSESPPSRSCIEVRGLTTPEKRIEIEVVAGISGN
jgi:2-iminobutanoate/2-iminopropanoate deaminase